MLTLNIVIYIAATILVGFIFVMNIKAELR